MNARRDPPRSFAVTAALSLALSGLALAPSKPVAADGEPASSADGAMASYTLGVFPYLSVPALESVFAPMAAELAAGVHREVRFTTTSTYEEFDQKLKDGEYDIAYVQPFDYVSFAVPAGYRPLATGYDRIHPAFFVPERSPIKEALDLRGKSVGMPPRRSAASYLGLMTLIDAGLTPGRDVKVIHFSSHQSCLQQAQIGNIEACVSAPDIVRMFRSQMNARFRTVLECPAIPGSLFVAHPRIPEKERELMLKTLLATHLDGVPVALRRLFKEADQPDGRYFQPVRESDYDEIRRYLKVLNAEP